MSKHREELARLIANHQDARMGALMEQEITVADYELADVIAPWMLEKVEKAKANGFRDGWFAVSVEHIDGTDINPVNGAPLNPVKP